MQKLRSLLAGLISVMVVGGGIQSAAANVIGSFDTRSGVYSGGALFTFFGGSFFGGATTALTNDGHSFVNLDTGINATSLNGVDSVYLPIATSNTTISAAEVTELQNFVSGGGNLVVQADLSSYDTLLSGYGVTRNQFPGTSSPHAVVNSFAPLTNGPHGTVSSFSTAVASTFTLGSGGVALDAQSVIAVLSAGNGLAAGSGTVVLLGDVNTFDGPGNANGISQEDNAVLWRNIFAMDGGTQIPEPGALIIFGLGLVGLVGVRKRNIANRLVW